MKKLTLLLAIIVLSSCGVSKRKHHTKLSEEWAEEWTETPVYDHSNCSDECEELLKPVEKRKPHDR